jgi:hypothetical protein
MQFQISKFPHFGHQKVQKINNLQNHSILAKFVMTIFLDKYPNLPS